jgi:NADH-quinone oxidoreductase subunit G
MGAKPDLEIFGLIARYMRADAGVAKPDAVFREIPPLALANGHIPVDAAAAAQVRSSRDTLFTSGTLGRYSKLLSSVMEAPGALYRK